MSLSARIFIVYMVFVALCSYFVLNTVMGEIKPGVRQSTEETLVDTANLLAEFLKEPLLKQELKSASIENILAAYGKRQPNAEIWGVNKQQVNHRIYVTDSHGIVLLDSQHLAEGQDYSRWNDVYLTLQGHYGARSTQVVANDPSSTVMYVGAPIKHNGKIIGVVSVAKPNHSLQPYIERSRKRLIVLGSGLIILGLISGALFSWWLSRELRRLREYAISVSQGRRVALPKSNIVSRELQQLAQALESMRLELDGKAYVDHYVQTMAHELKSPLAAIRASAELLQSPMSSEQQAKFIRNIDAESQRLEQLIERLLNLAHIEQLQVLQESKPVHLNQVIDELIQRCAAPIAQAGIDIVREYEGELWVEGDEFLLRQALSNLLENALDFTPEFGVISISIVASSSLRQIAITNTGEPIPEYALARITERFYSLARPATGKKSTGLGLSLVQEVMHLHKGKLQVKNGESGVVASLIFN